MRAKVQYVDSRLGLPRFGQEAYWEGILELTNDRLSLSIEATNLHDIGNKELVKVASAHPLQNKNYLENRWDTKVYDGIEFGTQLVLLFDVPLSAARLKWITKLGYTTAFKILENGHEWSRLYFLGGLRTPLHHPHIHVEPTHAPGIFQFLSLAITWTRAINRASNTKG